MVGVVVWIALFLLWEIVIGPPEGWPVWWRRMRWHAFRLKQDPEDAVMQQADPPEWFV